MPFAKIMSFEQFAAQEGASRQAFGDAGLHRSAESISRRTWSRIVEHQARLDEALADRRGELRAEYQRLVSEGYIIEPTADQRLEAASQGEGEGAAAARRILAKKAQRRSTSSDPAA